MNIEELRRRRAEVKKWIEVEDFDALMRLYEGLHKWRDVSTREKGKEYVVYVQHAYREEFFKDLATCYGQEGFVHEKGFYYWWQVKGIIEVPPIEVKA